MEGGSETSRSKQGLGSKPTSVESAGSRLRFTVDLQPGETTVVSWKKLLWETTLRNSNRHESSSGSSFEAKDSFVFEPLPPMVSFSSKQKMENETDTSQGQIRSSRLNTVIEKIERMYADNESSDEEDPVLDNVPDDDEYDTEDSFIDDTELDNYFQVDNCTIKHDGFFINRGKLECIEPIISADQEPKKRRLEELIKGGGSDEELNPQKIMKRGKKGKTTSSSIQPNSTNQYGEEALPNVHMLVQDSPANAAEVPVKKTADIQVTGEPSGPRRVDATRHNKAALMQRTEAPSVGAKSTVLEKAIKELENIVAELRPPSTESKDLDNASQAVKTLPPEIKQNLAEVARIVHARYSKVPKDMINHLMSIVCHLDAYYNA